MTNQRGPTVSADTVDGHPIAMLCEASTSVVAVPIAFNLRRPSQWSLDVLRINKMMYTVDSLVE